MRAAFLKSDVSLQQQLFDTEYSGSTCVCQVVTPDKIFSANLGDS